jgi:hypothetical protein
MDRRTLMTTVLIAALIFVAGACKQKQKVSTTDVLEQAEKTASMSKQVIDEKRNQFMMKVGKRMNELRGEIVQMQEKYEGMNDQARQKYSAVMEKVKVSRDNAHQRLIALRDASDDAWEDMQDGVNGALDELDKAYEEAKKEMP